MKDLTDLLNGFADEILLNEDAEKGEFYWQKQDESITSGNYYIILSK